MTDTDTDTTAQIDDASRATEALDQRMRGLESGANGFARAMTRAFSSSVTGGKQFDDILKSLTLRLSDMAVRMAFRPLEQGIASSLSGMFSGLFGGTATGTLRAAQGAIKPFAAGGVIGTPSYFPMMNGGVGLAGEAGPEAIMPLTRGADVHRVLQRGPWRCQVQSGSDSVRTPWFGKRGRDDRCLFLHRRRVRNF